MIFTSTDVHTKATALPFDANGGHVCLPHILVVSLVGKRDQDKQGTKGRQVRFGKIRGGAGDCQGYRLMAWTITLTVRGW
eukprot:m.162962 g.162962  ORF g.162962 m.162962 type:complete len:80 (-) comp12250_c0_seq1:2750-2989(-)